MNKSELIEAVAAKTGQGKSEVEKTLSAVLDTIMDMAAKGDRVNLVGFGIFRTVQREAREGRNPATGEVITIGAATLPKFVPGKMFKTRVNG